jgi:hypothetical protein
MARIPVRLHLPLFLLVFLLAGFWNLEGPAPWWDEGWTLSVARTQVERGAYARLLDGQLAPNGLEAAPPVTELAVLGFRTFGVGLWQGRLPFVVVATAALAMLFLAARRAYDEQVAWGTLVVALLIGEPSLHPLIQGRQVLAELPMLAVLLGAFVVGDLAARRWLWLLLPASLLWGLAAALKTQPLPFMIISLAIGALAALLLRRWRYLAVFAAGLICAVPIRLALLELFYRLVNPPLPIQPVVGLTETMAVVLELSNRLFTLDRWLAFGIPATAGSGAPGAPLSIVRIAPMCLCFAPPWQGSCWPGSHGLYCSPPELLAT